MVQTIKKKFARFAGTIVVLTVISCGKDNRFRDVRIASGSGDDEETIIGEIAPQPSETSADLEATNPDGILIGLSMATDIVPDSDPHSLVYFVINEIPEGTRSIEIDGIDQAIPVDPNDTEIIIGMGIPMYNIADVTFTLLSESGIVLRTSKTEVQTRSFVQTYDNLSINSTSRVALQDLWSILHADANTWVPVDLDRGEVQIVQSKRRNTQRVHYTHQGDDGQVELVLSDGLRGHLYQRNQVKPVSTGTLLDLYSGEEIGLTPSFQDGWTGATEYAQIMFVPQ